MARNISSFTKVMTAPSQWLESVDPRLGAMGDLVESGKVTEAADAAEDVLAEGFLDIRPISVLLYAEFVAAGVDAIPAILEAADLAIRDNFDAIGPKQKKKPLFDKRIGWLFDRIASQLEYHDKAKSDQFAAWTDGVAAERIEAAALAAATLTSALASKEYDAAPRAAGRLTTWLKGRSEAANAEVAAALAAAAPPPEPLPSKNKTIVPEDDSRHVTLAVSHKFAELLQKLRAFEALIAKGRHEKAAVVAADVQQLISQFDPRTYFPELFSGFAALMSDNVNTISGHMEMRDSPAWNALDQFYRVDLKAFVDR